MTNLRLLTIISALTMAATGISSILTSLYLQSLGATFSQIAFIQASVVITTLVASYLWGRFSDQLGRRKPILVIGLAIIGIAYFFLSQAPTSGWAWAARVFEGTGSAAYATLSLAMMGDLLEKEKQRGRTIGVWRGLGSLSFAIGAVSGGWIAEQTTQATALLMCVGLYGTAAFCALWLRDLQPQPATIPQTVNTTSPTAASSTSKPMLPFIFLLGVFFWICAHSASASMWPNYMQSFGYTSTASGFLWGMAAVVEMVVMYFAGSFSDKLGRPPLMVVGALGISLTNLGYLTLAGFFPALLAIQLMRGVGFGSYTTAAMTFAAEHGEQKTRGRKTGIYNTATSAGGLIGTFIAGNLVQFLGFGTLYATCSVLAFTGAICFWALNRHTTNQLAPSESATG
jgi:MFS family permease